MTKSALINQLTNFLSSSLRHAKHHLKPPWARLSVRGLAITSAFLILEMFTNMSFYRQPKGFCMNSFLQPLVLSDETVFALSQHFSKLFRELAASSLEQFFPTPVTTLSPGKEKGRFLAAYVGVHYLRVAFIDLPGELETQVNGQPGRRTLEKTWSLNEHLRRDNAKDLFAWIGDCVAEVVENSLTGIDDPLELVMGISFSFPLKCVDSSPLAFAGFVSNSWLTFTGIGDSTGLY